MLVFKKLKQLTPNLLKIILKNFRFKFINDQYVNISWSQEGEDLILKRIFENKQSGFYIDIGAHHPKRFSNTFLFYNLGWQGINIDAMPGSMNIFNKIRKRDINLEIGVSEQKEKSKYYIFNDLAINSFSKDLSDLRDKSPADYNIKEIKMINTMPLYEILDKYLPAGQSIDFMSVDAEGYDFQVLKSNNWMKYRPKYVLVEILEFDFNKFSKNEVNCFMSDNGYVFYAKSLNTVFFKDTTIK